MIPRTAPASTGLMRSLAPRRLRRGYASLSTHAYRLPSFPRVALQHIKCPQSTTSHSIARTRAFSTSLNLKASPQSADAIVDTLTDLYSTARDEFEIAAEETEKKTVYAADDRDAAREAFAELKNAFEEALKTSDPEVGKEVQGRVGQRVRELENALTALEESAMED